MAAYKDIEEMSAEDMEEIDNSTIPFYMRELLTYKSYMKRMRRLENEAQYEKLTGRKRAGSVTEEPAPIVPKYHVRSLDLNSWRENNQNNNSIYHINEEVLTSHLPQKTSKKKLAQSLESREEMPRSESSFELRQERDYIDTVQRCYRVSVRSGPKHVLVHTLKEYNRPTTRDSTVSYGCPRESSTASSPCVPIQTVMIKKVPSKALSVTSSRSASPCKQSRPGAKSEFCDVLGPVSCQRCIESVNRNLACDIQGSSFPVDCTTSKLVGPTLMKLMIDPRFKAADSHTIVQRKHPTRSKTSHSMPAGGFYRDTPSPFKLPVLNMQAPKRRTSVVSSASCSVSIDNGFLAGQAMVARAKAAGRRSAVIYSARTT